MLYLIGEANSNAEKDTTNNKHGKILSCCI